MAEKFRMENGLLLSDTTMVEFADGCADAGTFVPGTHEAGEVVPCPGCDGEHRIASVLQVEVAHNITVTKAEPADDDDEPGT
ncbi:MULTISPECIES: hypothetical protein [Pseudonocardia]|uniref:hypothetical protein n=1 Tax=Pseudonocardia TaxID=1847 RepID=UPI00247A418F|nr:hypothetical protein [Pseudonocardia alni]